MKSASLKTALGVTYNTPTAEQRAKKNSAWSVEIIGVRKNTRRGTKSVCARLRGAFFKRI